MKIAKKIFALSTSAILGLSFCAGTAFANTPVTRGGQRYLIGPRLGLLRRSPSMRFFFRDGRIIGVKVDDPCHIDMNLVEAGEELEFTPLVTPIEDEELHQILGEEKPKLFDLCLSIVESNRSLAERVSEEIDRYM